MEHRMHVLLVFLGVLVLATSAAPPFMVDRRQSLMSVFPDSHIPAAAAADQPRHRHAEVIQAYMENLWRQQQQRDQASFSNIIAITPISERSSHRAHVIVFSDPDLSTSFDSGELLFLGEHCPASVRVKVCPSSTACHHRKLSNHLTQMPEHYASPLKGVHGPLLPTSPADLPSMQITINVRMPSCRLIGLLLISPVSFPSLNSAPSRVRRFASPSSAAGIGGGSSGGDTPDTSQLCRMVPWTVTRDSIGVENLLKPDELTVNKCVGMCTVDVRSYSNHAYVRHLYNRIHPDSEQVPEPCCVPIQVEPKRVLLLNEHSNSAMVVLEDMVVLKCGCL